MLNARDRLFPLLFSGFLLFIFSYPLLAQEEEVESEYQAPRILSELWRRGLDITPIDNEFAVRFGVPLSSGLLITPSACVSETAPEDQWPEPWDIIVMCNGSEISTQADLYDHTEGQGRVDLVVFRHGLKIPLTLELKNAETAGDSLAESASSMSERERVKILYYPQDEDPWNDIFSTLEEGSGTISGTVTVDGKPAEGLQISIILAGKRRTERATVGPDGHFQVNLPEGTYSYIGYALSGSNMPRSNMVPIDRKLRSPLSPEFEPPTQDSDETLQRFLDLADKFGEEQAAQMLAEELPPDVNPIDVNYPLAVTASSVVTIPDIIYMSPIKIIAPLHNSTVSLDKLRFAWALYDGASHYAVEISHITTEGRTRTYSIVASETAYGNTLDAASVTFNKERWMIRHEGEDFRSGQRYGVRLFAYDRNEKVISASHEHSCVEFVIK